MTKSISIYGRATLSESEQAQFSEPWQAEALALSMALIQAGRFSSAEWAESLGATIRRAQASGNSDDGSTYYNHVLDALEHLVLDKLPLTAGMLACRKEAWRAAFFRTPHGKPVNLD